LRRCESADADRLCRRLIAGLTTRSYAFHATVTGSCMLHRAIGNELAANARQPLREEREAHIATSALPSRPARQRKAYLQAVPLSRGSFAAHACKCNKRSLIAAKGSTGANSAPRTI
jgi:hypothetical protein